MTGFEFFAGIDCGSETHQVCVVDSDGKTMGERAFRHSGAGLAEMTDWLLGTTNTQSHAIAVAIEVPHGPVVETMKERGFTVHSVNPKQLDRFRDRWSPAGAMDDRRDAGTLADALRTDDQAFRRPDLAAPEVVELREWSRIASDLTRDQTRLVNRASQQLWRYYPQLLKVESNLARPWARELWSLVPTPEKTRRIRTMTVANLLKRHRVRRISAEDVLDRLREPAISIAPGTAEAAAARLQVVFSQQAVTGRQLARAYREMDHLTAILHGSALSSEEEQRTPAQRDADILNSLPGIGGIVLATLLAEAHDAVGGETIRLCDVSAAWRRSPGAPASLSLWCGARLPTTGFRTRSTIEPASLSSMTPSERPSTPHSVLAVTVMHVRFTARRTACCRLHAPCRNTGPCSITVCGIKFLPRDSRRTVVRASFSAGTEPPNTA